MRVLLDECVPKRFGRSLVGHVVRTVPQEGWSGKKNGELLALMSAAGFEVLLTVDQGIPHQQNFRAAGLALDRGGSGHLAGWAGRDEAHHGPVIAPGGPRRTRPTLPSSGEAIASKVRNRELHPRAAGVAVVVMVGASNQLVDLLPLVPDLLATLGKVQAGNAVEVRA